MRIFLAGATGVIGSRLVPLLVADGHEVLGMTRSSAKSGALEAQGATALVADVYDADGLVSAVTAFRPDIVLHELTDLPDSAAQLGDFRPANARIRIEGTRNLLRAASAAGTDRVIAQSIAWTLPPGEGADAVAELERTVLGFSDGSVVLRYGQFYGEGTFYPDALPDGPRVQIDTAARRTMEALRGPGGIRTIVDR
ncbi:NAD-dependent epimerase/dehydratase family protein [Leifsonia sp. NPDC080035]|uniref:NAD-dependent epimerase/dehydratase family protein n=1 Tax=Leifsonia sp. NPDC080035 TaxID=3143936 RepID=A0AAU7GB52_9MICO